MLAALFIMRLGTFIHFGCFNNTIRFTLLRVTLGLGLDHNHFLFDNHHPAFFCSLRFSILFLGGALVLFLLL